VFFAIVSVASAIGLRRICAACSRHRLRPQRARRGAGRQGVRARPADPGGRGRIKLGDGSWIVTGPDMVAGAKVRVAAVNGTELRVEPAP
jgi:membrane protein implicated in regulation of membrane protease activity